MAESRLERVRSRYDDLLGLFELQWRGHDHQSVHFGYHDEEHADAERAMVNTTKRLADLASVDGTDLVLDLGCGAGGDAVWLARERGARVLGVDLVASQLDRAHEHAVEAGVDGRVAFEQADFHELPIAEAGSIDVAWALESLSHSPDPAVAIERIRDVLGEEGRLVVGDVFLEDAAVSAAQRETLASIESSMGLEFSPVEAFTTALADGGFGEVEQWDVTPAIMPGARSSLDASSLLGPLARIGGALGIGSEAVEEYLAFRSDVHELLETDCVGYYFVRARTGDGSTT